MANTALGAEANGYAAEYDNNGRLLSVTSINIDLDEAGSKFQRKFIQIADTVKSVSLMVLDTALEPVTDVIKLER